MPWYDDYDEDYYEPRLSDDIYALRKQGQLDEARALAEQYIANKQANYDVWKAYAWTLIDICKRCQRNGDSQGAVAFANYLQNLSKKIFEPREEEDEFAGTLVQHIGRLRLLVNPNYARIKEANELSKNGENDRAWEIFREIAASGGVPEEAHEGYGWVIYRYLRDHLETLTSRQVREQLLDYINLKNARPSLLHSQILSFALKYSKQDEEFKLAVFLRMWGPDNLRSEDFQDSTAADGKTIPSLMSRIAGAVVNYPIADIQAFVDLLPFRKDDFIAMMKEGFFWNIYRSAVNDQPTAATWELFEEYLDFFPDAPASKAHSQVLGLAERWMKEDNAWRFYDFFRRWGPDKLLPADWEEEKSKDGEATFKSLALKAIKKARESMDSLSEEKIGDLQWLIDLYGVAAAKDPDDDWNIRSKALLHLRAGQLEEARAIYKDLCLKMGEKYYIWQEFADCWEDNATKIALLCKALSLEKNEDFIGKIRLELARQLIKAGKKENAAVEIRKYKAHYQQKGWKVSTDADALLESCGVSGEGDNKAFYEENIPLAEDCAFADIPYTEMVLVDRWKNEDGKELIAFTDGDKIEFVTNRRRFPLLNDSHRGQVWKVKLYREETVKVVAVPNPCRRQEKKEVSVRYSPLLLAPSDKKDWEGLPLHYGYIGHVNADKKVYQIYSSESVQLSDRFEQQKLKKGDFVSMRLYKRRVKDEVRTFVCDLRRCKTEDALERFPSKVAVVDDVNEQKQLFHFVLGTGLSGILHFDETRLRPSVGDCLNVHYYTRMKEDKKRPGSQIKVVEVVRAENAIESNHDLLRDIQGQLRLKFRDENYGGTPDFAFIGDYYVHKSILQKYSIHDDCYVKAKVINTGDGKWRVFEITEVVEDEDDD